MEEGEEEGLESSIISTGKTLPHGGQMRTNRFSFVISSGVKTSSTCMSVPVVGVSHLTTEHHEVLKALFANPPKSDELIEALLDHQNVLRDQ